jgi:isocitrate/isopropylmalate dehydrogenase
VHGSAPALAGKDLANPIATILTGGLMLEQLGHPDAARRIESAVRSVIADGPCTPDIGGRAGTRETARAVGEALC